MPKAHRINVGDIVYHALNRGNGRLPIFNTQGDYEAFLRVLIYAQQKVPMRVVAYALMPNHWHFVLWPHSDGDLSLFMHRLTMTHTRRWQMAHEIVGMGHLYKGRFKNFPIEDNRHFLTVCHYVERNPLRAKLVARAEDWPWSSLHQRVSGITDGRPLLAEGPLPFPDDWLAMVNSDQQQAELKAIRECVVRGRPFGNDSWVKVVAKQMGLESTLRPRGRPQKR